MEDQVKELAGKSAKSHDSKHSCQFALAAMLLQVVVSLQKVTDTLIKNKK